MNGQIDVRKLQQADRDYQREKVIDRLAHCHESARSKWARRLADVESQIRRLNGGGAYKH